MLHNVVLPSLVSAFGWGLSPLFHKLNLELLNNNYIIAFALHCIYTGIFSLIICLAYVNDIKRFASNPHKKKIFLYGFLGAFAASILGYYFYFRSMAHSKNTLLVVLIVYILPVIITATVCHYALKQKINSGMLTGLIISIVGICIYTYFTPK